MISVIIPVHNRFDLLQYALISWGRQLCGDEEGYEIIVVDDNSSERVDPLIATGFYLVDHPWPEALEEWGRPDVRVLQLETALPLRSPNAAYLAGVAAARGDYYVLASQDVIVPQLALIGLTSTSHSAQGHGRRAALQVLWTTKAVKDRIAALHVPITNLFDITTLAGFWSEGTPYGRPNWQIQPYATIISGMTATVWTALGGLRDTPYFGMDDRDLAERERVLDKLPAIVPDLFAIHLWHEQSDKISHPGYTYRTEAQARLQEPAESRGEPQPLDLSTSAPEAPPSVATVGGCPQHIAELFTYILGIISRYGVKEIALPSLYWPWIFSAMAVDRGIRMVEFQADRQYQMVVSIMDIQRHENMREAVSMINWLRARAERLIVVVPDGQHFAGGENRVQFTVASLQAPVLHRGKTGYLVGVW